MVSDTDMGLKNTRMETYIKGCGRTAADTAMQYIIMQMVIDMKGNSRMINDKDMLRSSSKMGANKRENGKIANRMDSILNIMDPLSLDLFTIKVK